MSGRTRNRGSAAAWLLRLALLAPIGACGAGSTGSDTSGMNFITASGGTGSIMGGGGGQGAITPGTGGSSVTTNGGGGAMLGSGGTHGSPSGGAGMTGSGGMIANTGMMGGAGMMGMAGMGSAGMGSAGMGSAGMGGMGAGMCCADGNCLCHGPDPTELTSGSGPFKTDSYDLSTGTVYYPTDADPPFAAIAIIPGFLNTGPEMAPWGPFYASWGIVLIQTSSGAADTPDIRAGELLAAVTELKAENTKSGSPLSGKLSDRFGTSGYSMGGGGTTIAATMDSTLKTSIGLAPWGGTGAGDTVPTLLFCGDADTVAPCNMSDPVYMEIADSTPKMEIVVSGATHFNWFDPADAGGGTSGKYALAFEKVFLEGDERWKSLLLQSPTAAMQTTNIH